MVRDADHLAGRGEVAQTFAHGARGVAPDPGVDLVEHQRGLGVEVGLGAWAGGGAWAWGGAGVGGAPAFGADGAQREHHSRELPAGCDLAQRARGDAGIGRDLELHRVAAAGAGLALGQPHGEGRLGHRERDELLTDRFGQAWGSLCARRAQGLYALLQRLLGGL